MRGCIIGVMALVAGMAQPVSAQVHDRDIAFEHCVYLIRTVHNLADRAHEPYTVEYQVSRQLLQKDGTTKTVEYSEVFAIDSQDRWLNSRTVAPSLEEDLPSTQFCVYDPVAGIRTTWSVPGKVATQMKVAEIESSYASCAKSETSVAEISRSKPAVEDLGTKSIQGYLAQGFKTSRSIPKRINGNSQTIVRTVETWRAAVSGLNFSPGVELTAHSHFDDPWFWSKSEKLEYLGQKPMESLATALARSSLLVRQVIDDPENGKESEELTDFRQVDPAPDLFQPPEGYKIVLKKAQPAACPAENAAAPIELPAPTP